jgi:putative FmdB family regulatory protein
MPIYEYKCTGCDELFEIKQSFNDKPVTVCHLCGKEARRVFKPAPIIFKGSGFYVTDHAKKDKENKPENKKNLEKSTSSTEPVSDSAGTDNGIKKNTSDKNPVNKKEEGSGS